MMTILIRIIITIKAIILIKTTIIKQIIIVIINIMITKIIIKIIDNNSNTFNSNNVSVFGWLENMPFSTVFIQYFNSISFISCRQVYELTYLLG